MLTELQALSDWVGWPPVVALLLLAGSAVIFLLKHRIEALRNQLAGLASKSTSVADLDTEALIQITSPRPGEKVHRSFRVHGTFQHLPKDLQLWVCTVEGDGSQRIYWPQQPAASISRQTKSWRAQVNWLEGKPGETKEIAICIVGPNGETLFEYYVRAGLQSESWPGILHLPGDISECATQQVIIDSERTT